MFDWRINRTNYRLPNRPFAKTNKDNRWARLVDINAIVDETNEILEQIGEAFENLDLAPTCDIVLDPTTVELDTSVSFSKPPESPVIDKIITGVLEINRGPFGGIFNSVTELGYNDPISPADTEWNSVYTDPINNGHSNLESIPNRVFGTWKEALDNQAGNTILSTPLVMRHIPTGRVWLFTFTDWGVGPFADNFAYTRQEVTVESCSITFSDQTVQSTAAGSVNAGDNVSVVKEVSPEGLVSYTVSATSENTWDIRNVAFLSTFGNDSTGVVGDGNSPFRTFNGANASGASVIYIIDGSWGTETITSNKVYYFYPGTQVYRLRDGGSTVTNTKVLGYAKFRSFGYGVELTGANSDIYVECDEFDNVRSIAWLLGSNCKCIIKTRKVFANGFNGGAYACAVRNGSYLEVTATESTTLYYWLVANSGVGNTFIYRCPDIRQIPGGNYGSTPFGDLINHQGSVASANYYEVDFMGGKLTRTRGQGNSFGVRDSALLKYVNTFLGSDPTKVVFKNGSVDAGNTLGILLEYILYTGQIELDNIKLKSTSKPIEMSQRATNAAGADVTFVARRCDFEGGIDNELGNGRIARFFDCNFKTLGGASNFTFNNSNTASPGQAYFVNCNAELVGGPGEMLTGFTGKIIGLLNTNHNQPIGVGAVDTWGGANEVATLTLPNLEL